VCLAKCSNAWSVTFFVLAKCLWNCLRTSALVPWDGMECVPYSPLVMLGLPNALHNLQRSGYWEPLCTQTAVTIRGTHDTFGLQQEGLFDSHFWSKAREDWQHSHVCTADIKCCVRLSLGRLCWLPGVLLLPWGWVRVVLIFSTNSLQDSKLAHFQKC